MYDLILLCAGSSTRFKSRVKKQWLRIKDKPLWQFNAKKMKKKFDFNQIIIVADKNDISYMKKIDPFFTYVEGGELRQISVKNALEVVKTDFVFITDCARIFSAKIVKNLLKAHKKNQEFNSFVPYIDVVDTTYFKDELINRSDLKLIQTPGLHKTSLLKKALQSDKIFSDESSALKSINEKIYFVKGSKKAQKITYLKDLKSVKLKPASKEIFVGSGFDLHKIEEKNNSSFMLCGVEIPSNFKVIAHSDGDVGIHSLIDALLGASLLGDIGELFPDSDEKYKNISSIILLEKVVKKIFSYGFDVVNIDMTLIIQKPKILDFKEKMVKILSKILKTKNINIKATTSEGVGVIGEGKAIASKCIATLKFYDQKGKI